jgi:hypothetical protein
VHSAACTNVRGPKEALRILGRRVSEIHPIMNLFQGVGLTFAVASYAGRLSICAATDPRLLPDGERLMQAVEEAIYELRSEHWRTSAALRIAQGLAARTRRDAAPATSGAIAPAASVVPVVVPERSGGDAQPARMTRRARERDPLPRRPRPAVDVSLLTDPDLSFGPETYAHDGEDDALAANGADDVLHDVAPDRGASGRAATRRFLG